MRECIFCLNKVENKFIKDCKYCKLENICMECMLIHDKAHNKKKLNLKSSFKEKGYDNEASQMLENMLNFNRNDLSEGNSTGMY